MPDFLVTSWRLPRSICYGEVTGKLVPVEFELNVAWLCVQHGLNAVSMTVAEQYIAAFSNLAKETNTVLLPANSGDVSGMVSQVRTVPEN